MEMKMTIDKLKNDFWIYDRDCWGAEFPMNSISFNEIWENWRIDNKINIKDAILLWDDMIKTDWIDNTIGDYDDIDYKKLYQQIRLLKINCDF